MKIGVISDTHDKLPTIDAALNYFSSEAVDLIIHCGDWKSAETVRYFADKAKQCNLPFKAVLGNNDLAITDMLTMRRQSSPKFEIREGVSNFPLDNGVEAAIYHGHHKPTLRKLLQDVDVTVVFLGHTHKPLITRNEHQLIINPGSTAFAIPRSKTWRPSVALLDTVTMDAEIKYVDI